MPPPDKESAFLDPLIQRFGERFVRERLLQQALLEAAILKQRYRLPGFLKSKFCIKLLELTGIANIGKRNCLKIKTIKNTITVPTLPKACDGMRILHLSDLHFDFLDGLLGHCIKAIEPLEYDLCVITGDFRTKDFPDFTPAIEASKELIRALKTPSFGIFGNHDILETLAPLESSGIRILLNESCLFEFRGETLYFAGTDDSSFYTTHSIAKTLADVPQEACTILLSHYAEIHREAALYNCDLLLCGHTHGGQVCLPGGIPIARSGCRRDSIGGPWANQQVPCYTHRGTGSCLIPIRFFCPPEVVVHTLRST